MKTSIVAVIVCGSLSLIGWMGTRIVADIRYDQRVGGFLKQAADANTTALAEEKLLKAIRGMDNMHLCSGLESEGGGLLFSKDCYTSIAYRTPDEDIGFWRTNIQATYEDLRTMTDAERADNLIESNQLMKVRETLLDSGAEGRSVVTAPQGLPIYPSNTSFFWWCMISCVALGLGGVAAVRDA